MSLMIDIAEEYGPATNRRLNSAWSGWGAVDQQVIAHLISPSFMGGPHWPTTRQAHLIARRDDELLVASDGLADPMEWDDADPSNGYGVEVYAMTADHFEDTSTMAIPGTWLGMVVMGVSSTVAQNGATFGRMLEAEGTLTVAFDASGLPEAANEHYVDEQGAAVVMLGVTGAEIPDVVEGASVADSAGERQAADCRRGRVLCPARFGQPGGPRRTGAPLPGAGQPLALQPRQAVDGGMSRRTRVAESVERRAFRHSRRWTGGPPARGRRQARTTVTATNATKSAKPVHTMA